MAVSMAEGDFMTINSIRIGDTASTTYLVSDYYNIAVKDDNETSTFSPIYKDGTLFLVKFKNGVSEEDILKFKSEPLEFCVVKLPSKVQVFHIFGPVEEALLVTEDMSTLKAVLKKGNEELYMVLVDTKTDKIATLRNAELPYCVRKAIYNCGKSVTRTGITDSEKLEKAVTSEFNSLLENNIPPHVTYLGQEAQNKFPNATLFISE